MYPGIFPLNTSEVTFQFRQKLHKYRKRTAQTAWRPKSIAFIQTKLWITSWSYIRVVAKFSKNRDAEGRIGHWCENVERGIFWFHHDFRATQSRHLLIVWWGKSTVQKLKLVELKWRDGFFLYSRKTPHLFVWSSSFLTRTVFMTSTSVRN